MATNVQQLIQGLAPLQANNGNPNTVYNTPASPFANPAQGLPANWTLGSLPSYKAPNWQQLAANAPQPLDNFKGFNLGVFQPPSGWPGIQPPPTPPPTTGGGGGDNPPPNVNTGGPDLPRRNPNLGGGDAGGGGQWWRNPNDPRLNNAYGSGKGYDILDPDMQKLMDQVYTSRAPDGNSVISKGDFLGALRGLDAPDLQLGSLGQQLYGTSLGRALGVKSDGSVSVLQIIDWITPGNIVMGQTGKINLANLIPTITGSLLGPLAGFGVNAWMNNTGSTFANATDDQIAQSAQKFGPLKKIVAWWRRLCRDRYNMNKENRQNGRNANRGGGDAGGLRGPSGGMGGRGGTFIGGSYGWDGRNGGGTWTIDIGGTGPGQISDFSGSGSGNVYLDVNQK